MIDLERYPKNFEEEYFSNLQNFLNGRRAKVIEFINHFLSEDDKLNNLKDLILLPAKDIKKLKDKLDSSSEYSSFLAKYKDTAKQEDVNNEYYGIRTYVSYYKKFFTESKNNFGIKYNIDLVKNGNSIVCPYCNRNYINDRSDKMGADLDHFYPRDRYPAFSLCLYNLVPSCTVCNRIKGKEDLNINPFIKSTADQTYEFKFTDLNPITFECKIEIESQSIERMEDFHTLRIEEGYQVHASDVIDFFNREKLYPLLYKQELSKIMNLGTEGMLDIDFLLYGEIIDGNYGRIPAGLLKKALYEKIKSLRDY